jgi:segregation and condensation protein A
MPPPVQEPLLNSLDHSIRLPMFEGPLDLLLFLIRKNELDIHDIPIESVTRQYLDVLHAMERLDLDIAGDFFVMAATLMYIKSRLLLPKHEQDAQPPDREEDEHLDPRWALVQQLLEYRKIKDAAAGLQILIARGQNLLPRLYQENDDDRERRPLQPGDRIELWNTFNLVLRRLAEKMVLGEIHQDQVTVADRMEHILKVRATHRRFTFTGLLPEHPSLVMIVATFLAVLELARLRQVGLAQTEDFSDIEITRRDDVLPAPAFDGEAESAILPESEPPAAPVAATADADLAEPEAAAPPADTEVKAQI